MDRNTAVLGSYIVAIGALVIVMAGSLAVYDRSHRRTEEDGLSAQRAEARAGALQAGRLVVERAAAFPLEIGPFSAAWDDVPEKEVPLQPQKMAMPMLEEASVQTAIVQSITDGRRIAWRLSWADPAPDMNVDVGRFCDAVALQFPLGRRAPFTMGGHGEPVQIFHWKALWQKDIDEHFQDVQDVHPNYWADLYWFAEGEFPYAVPGAFGDERSHEWFVARQAGNPLASFDRRQPVEELIAEGYGSSTTHPDSELTGRGEWKDGRWAVVFSRPLETADPVDRQFFATSRSHFSVAVWEGGAGNVGGRKHWSDWAEYEVLR